MSKPKDFAVTAQQMIAREMKEDGYCRWDDPEEGTKYGRWYAELTGEPWFGNNDVAFCAMGQSYTFWDLMQSAPGLPTAGCGDVRNAAIAQAKRVDPKDAKPGDLVLFRWDGNVDDLSYSDHIAMCVVNYPGRNGGRMQTFEFNTTIDGRSGSVGPRVRDYSVIQMCVRPAYKDADDDASNLPGVLEIDGLWGRATTLRVQEIIGAPYKDGVISRQNSDHRSKLQGCTTGWEWKKGGEKPGSPTIALLQKAWGVPEDQCDGLMGPVSANYMIAYYMKLGSGATQKDGRLDCPSITVMAFQERLNDRRI